VRQSRNSTEGVGTHDLLFFHWLNYFVTAFSLLIFVIKREILKK
jgi:hypothetical protein